MKKTFFLLPALLLFCACGKETPADNPLTAFPNRWHGGYAFASPGHIEVQASDSDWFKRRETPCSTFKIFTALTALEYGIVADSQTRLGYDGQIHANRAWNTDVTLDSAFRESCVWYFQKIIGALPKETVQQKLAECRYGNADLSAWNDSGHNTFWIESSLKISPEEQLAFLKSVFEKNQHFKPEHIKVVEALMRYPDAGEWMFYGKTGTGRNYSSGHLEGWTVGFIQPRNSARKTFFAARFADPGADVMGPGVRDFLRRILEQKP